MRTYEHLAMLTKIIPKVHIDKDWVAPDYLRRCMESVRKEESNNEVLKCWNLERILDAELLGNEMPPELTIDDLMNGSSTTSSHSNIGSDDESIEVVA